MRTKATEKLISNLIVHGVPANTAGVTVQLAVVVEMTTAIKAAIAELRQKKPVDLPSKIAYTSQYALLRCMVKHASAIMPSPNQAGSEYQDFVTSQTEKMLQIDGLLDEFAALQSEAIAEETKYVSNLEQVNAGYIQRIQQLENQLGTKK